MRNKYSLLLLALLQLTTPSAAQDNVTVSTTVITTTTTTTKNTSAPAASDPGYLTDPANVTVAVGEPAVFRCGVPEESPKLTFTFYGNHGIYSLDCPYGPDVEDTLQALHGSCEIKAGESVAVWTLRGTSFPDNSTRVVCRRPDHPDARTAVLYVYDDGYSYALLVGCIIGAFFGTLLVFGLSYFALLNSETLTRLFRGKDTEDDLTTIVDSEKTKAKDHQ